MEVIFLTPNLRTEKRDRNVGEKLIEDAWEVNAENERNGLHDILTWQGRYVRAGWCTNEYKGTGYIG
ncbi:MAG: hypothetical protein KIG65_03720 [Eubacteriales bacterium]|nr:hypothetical protein [Eubacteriales bacterium]